MSRMAMSLLRVATLACLGTCFVQILATYQLYQVPSGTRRAHRWVLQPQAVVMPAIRWQRKLAPVKCVCTRTCASENTYMHACIHTYIHPPRSAQHTAQAQPGSGLPKRKPLASRTHWRSCALSIVCSGHRRHWCRPLCLPCQQLREWVPTAP